MAEILLSTLGRLRLSREGEEVLPGRRMELVLLAYLADRSPRAVSRAHLATLLWGERSEHRARHSLRQALFKLRRALGDEVVEVTRDSVRIREGALALDVREMESALEAGRPGTAAEWWQGDFLPGVDAVGTEPLRTWVDAERERLRSRYRSALEQLTEDARTRGAWDEAVRWSSRWTEADPLEERAAARLIEALRLARRHDEAASVHAAFSARLRQTLEVDPSPEFQRLGDADPAPPDHSGGRRSTRARPSSSAFFTPDLVGRAEAFAGLAAAWEGVEAGAVALVEGEAGAGRTRLCEDFLRWLDISHSEAYILRSRALRIEHGRPRGGAAHLFAGVERAPGLGGAPAQALAAVGRLVPGVRERFPRLPDPPDDTPLDEALRRVLADVAAEAPVVVFLDDLTAADVDTIRLLHSLAARPPERVFFLFTARVDEPGADAAVQPFREIAGVHRVVLTPLAAPDVETLLASMVVLKDEDRHALARRLHAAAAGNPFYTIALLTALADAGDLAPDAQGVWRLASSVADAPLPLPSDLRDAIHVRLRHLDPDARRVLDAAAVLRRPIEPPLLEAVTALPAGRFAAAVEILLRRRLLRALPPPDAAYEFHHDLIGRVAYDLLSPPRRRSLHRLALEALARGSHGSEEVRAALDHHRERSDLDLVPGRRRRRVAVAGVLLALAVVAGASAWSAARTAGHRTPTEGEPPSLAVLYLDDRSENASGTYLAAGLTEEIAARLSQLGRLRVKSPRATRRFEGAARLDPTSIGDSLGVAYLVDGSVRRGDGRLRIAVRLTSTRDGFQMWNESYDVHGERLLDIQDTIIRQIATRIAGRLVSDERRTLGRRATQDPRAYDLFLRGNHHLARRTPASVLRAIEAYREAARIDPGFSAASAREAYGYGLFLDWGWSFPDLSPEELLARGLLLTESVLHGDSTSADAWMARGYLFVLRDPVRHRGAAEAFQRSIELDGGNAEVHHQLGQTLMVLDRLDEAGTAYRRALALEPDRAMTFVPLAAIHMRRGEVPAARRLMDSAIAVDPSVPYARAASGLQRLVVGDAEGARADAETALQLDRSYSVPGRAVLAAALDRLGDPAAAGEMLERTRGELADPARPSPTEMFYLGAALVVMKRHEELFVLVERTHPLGAWVWFYLQYPIFDPLRDHPRLRAVLDEIRPR
jgi:DNA-binding SARP family transcriptional activator/TolB-like protein/Tfp pilus assembly protein PilF